MTVIDPPAGCTWWWSLDGEDYQQAETKEQAIAAGTEAVEESEDGDERSFTVAFGCPTELTDQIFNVSDIMDDFADCNLEAQGQEGLLCMNITGEQDAELQQALVATFAAWRKKHGIGCSRTLDFISEETITVPSSAAALVYS